MWRLAGEPADARALAEAALDAGITLFDTADIYGAQEQGGFGAAETLFGRILAETPGLRDRIVLATKGGIVPGVPYNSSAGYLDRAIEASLRRLGVEQVDLWQVHRPDLLAHPQELAATLERFVTSGKARAIGVSNFTPAQVAALESFLTVPLASIQPEFSPLYTAPLWDGTLDAAMARDHAVLAWSPLGGGRIAQGQGDAADLLAAKAEASGVSVAAATYAWAMAHPARIIPIVGSQRAERIRESADAFRVEWTRVEWYKVLEAATGQKLP
ncbi:MAG: aldo/keto reductase [Sphingomonas sp.]|nr:aldo/keto reductase [Sphingomonas sp.]